MLMPMTPTPLTGFRSRLALGRYTPAPLLDPDEQDYNFVDGYYNGDAADTLRMGRNRTRATLTDLIHSSRGTDQALLDRTLADLGTGRSSYRTSADSLIGTHEADLARARNGYLSRVQGHITQAEADQQAEYNDIQAAEDAAAAQSIADGVRANKAMFAQKGAGPSSYADRLGVGLRMRANTEKLQRLAAIKRANRMALEEQQRALDTNLSGMEHADLAAVYGDRSRFLDAANGQDRSDLGFGFTGQSNINDREASRLLGLETDLGNEARTDARYINDAQANYLGKRQKMPGAPADPFNFNFDFSLPSASKPLKYKLPKIKF